MLKAGGLYLSLYWKGEDINCVIRRWLFCLGVLYPMSSVQGIPVVPSSLLHLKKKKEKGVRSGVTMKSSSTVSQNHAWSFSKWIICLE